VQVGLASAQVDTVVNLPVPCDVGDLAPALQCTACNRMSGCQWCLGYCSGGKNSEGQGTCMVGTKDGPSYQVCPSGWGMCTASEMSTLTKVSVL
jgi:hypothetical protein